MKRPPLFALALLTATGCGPGSIDVPSLNESRNVGGPRSDAGPSGPDSPPIPPRNPDPGHADAGVPPDNRNRCAGFKKPNARDYTVTITHGGKNRTATVHIPPSYDASKPVGLVLNNHGSASSAKHQATMSGLNPRADRRGWVTVTAQGTGMMASWNAGECCGAAKRNNVDDVGFFDRLLTDLGKTICLDDKRLYCAGFSMGGSMCYRLACDLSHRIAAVASVGGPTANVDCRKQRRVPSLVHMHGTADTFVKYGGSGGPITDPKAVNRGAEGSVNRYAKRSGCHPTSRVTFAKGAVNCKTYGGCRNAATATLCTITGGGHTWPGGQGWLLGGAVNRDINASDFLLDFFAKNPLR